MDKISLKYGVYVSNKDNILKSFVGEFLNDEQVYQELIKDIIKLNDCYLIYQLLNTKWQNNSITIISQFIKIAYKYSTYKTFLFLLYAYYNWSNDESENYSIILKSDLKTSIVDLEKDQRKIDLVNLLFDNSSTIYGKSFKNLYYSDNKQKELVNREIIKNIRCYDKNTKKLVLN